MNLSGLTRLLLVIVLCWGILSACAKTANQQQAAQSAEPPQEYIGKTNPLLEESSDNSAGESIFSQNCVRCHGEHGKGDGDIAASLKPRPQDLTGNDGRLKDDYLFWRISEGGLAAPFASAMPAWKGILDEEQIWQVVSFLRTLQ